MFGLICLFHPPYIGVVMKYMTIQVPTVGMIMSQFTVDDYMNYMCEETKTELLIRLLKSATESEKVLIQELLQDND